MGVLALRDLGPHTNEELEGSQQGLCKGPEGTGQLCRPREGELGWEQRADSHIEGPGAVAVLRGSLAAPGERPPHLRSNFVWFSPPHLRSDFCRGLTHNCPHTSQKA